ncbi:hypothetical protein RZS08_11850, partial [Arthrospira platensis SPKY1]|nr:hypothetical protein [Arthrospira platensis SPKY1]
LAYARLRHCCACRATNRNTLKICSFKAVDVYPEVIRRYSLPMERVNTANLAEEVLSCLGVKLVLRERLLAREETKLALVHLDHERILLPANRTVARSQFRKVSLYLKADCATVTASLNLLHLAR